MIDNTRRSDLQRLAVNPVTGKTDLAVTLSMDRVKFLAKRGNKADLWRVTLIDNVLLYPKAIFSGIRFEEDEKHSCHSPGWLCYCGYPPIDFRLPGQETAPPVRKVFLVFVNEDQIAYNWGWERADSDTWDEGKYFPVNYQTRFQEQRI